MLSGNQLINTVQSLPEADIKQLVKTCGYISTRKDGTQKLNFNDFYVALLTAKAEQVIYLAKTIQLLKLI